MRRYLTLITLSLLAVASWAAKDPIVAEIAPYVSPENAPARPASLTYTPDGTAVVDLSADSRRVVTYDIRTGKETETLLDLDNTRETTLKDIEGFVISPEGSKIMVWRGSERIYRRSSRAHYYIYDRHSRILRPLSEEHPMQQAPLFSPDGRMVAFVADNNIYIRKIDYNTEVAVTTDGLKNQIINGVPDWVYEEEFQTKRSMVWAPDNLTLCFLKYNEKDVPQFTFSLYDGYCDPMPEYALYPGQFTYKYPVAGEPNSVVSLHSYDVETRKVKDITLPSDDLHYIPRIAYGGSPDLLIAVTLNRDQNHVVFYSVNPRSTVSKAIYDEKSKAWMLPDTYEAVTFNDDNFVVLSSRTGWTHLYQYSYAGQRLRQLTQGQYDVTAYYGADAQGNQYYQDAASSPLDRTVRRLDLKGRITALSPEKGWASAAFSPRRDYMVMQYSTATKAPVYTLMTAAGKDVRTLEDNAQYAARYKDVPHKEFFQMPTEGGVMLNGFVIRGRGNEAKQPCIMYQYSGPGSQEVMNKWGIDWYTYFALKGYTVVCVDGRGTGARGRAFSDVVYKDLGHYETIDQLAAARYAASLPWVDASRIGIFGWSYGGYETLMCASAPGNTYAAACAVAPVTDWRYYDTIYAERYMLTPQQNEDGYQASAPINRTESLSCPLLIQHGTADDNVHLSNTMQYVSRLQQEGQLCQMLLFPNKNHSIYGCGARAVVYANMMRFFNEQMR